MSTPKLPTPAEQQARYQQQLAEHRHDMQVWLDGGKRGPMPPHPVAPHTPGWPIPEDDDA